MKTFYEAIQLVLTKGKCMRRSSWDNGYRIIFINNNNTIMTTYVLIETPTEYKVYIPTPDDIISNDWLEDTL